MSKSTKVTEIILGEEISNLLQKKLKSPHVTDDAKRALIKRVVGGFCSNCGGIPTKLVTYDMEGASKIEKYCDGCFEKWDKSERKKLEF